MAFVPTQAAEFSGPGKRAVALYAPDWAELILGVLRSRPDAYEAGWRFAEAERAHVLQVDYPDGTSIPIALIDGIHNGVLALLARGAALVLSPYPLYPESPDAVVEKGFTPEESLALPTLPSPLAALH